MIEIDNRKKFVERVFNKNSAAIVVESSQYFIPYLDVMFKSMLSCANPENNYDIIVLGNEIEEYDEEVIRKAYCAYENVSIRFFNPHKLVESYIEEAQNKYLDINYYRLALPWILCKYDKAVQLGADIVVKRDLAELYRTEFTQDECLAGCRDLGYLGRLNMDIPKEELGMKNPGDYVNADVLVYNLKGIREKYDMDKIMQVWQKYPFRCAEQDALNMILDGGVKILDSRWNVFPTRMVSELHISNSPQKLQEQRMQDLKDPWIVHFAAIPKVWDYPMVGEGTTWWEFARQSVYYEEILRRLMIFTVKVENSHEKLSWAKRTELAFFPVGSKRRKAVKKIIPRNSALWNVAKAIKNGLHCVIVFLSGGHQETKYGKLRSSAK